MSKRSITAIARGIWFIEIMLLPCRPVIWSDACTLSRWHYCSTIQHYVHKVYGVLMCLWIYDRRLLIFTLFGLLAYVCDPPRCHTVWPRTHCPLWARNTPRSTALIISTTGSEKPRDAPHYLEMFLGISFSLLWPMFYSVFCCLRLFGFLLQRTMQSVSFWANVNIA